MHHTLRPDIQTCHWGFLDALQPPVLTIQSGDRVMVESVSGAADVMPNNGLRIPSALTRIQAGLPRILGPHILTGPIAIEGARPGHVLEVRIREVELVQEWGYMLIRPLDGTLPGEFEEYRLTHIPIDMERGTASPPWGGTLKTAPFFGVMGVAPPANWGRISSVAPRANGGNIDNKELVAGSTLYLPIFEEGALFSCGDGHALQGDGEVCVTAIETALRGTLEFVVRDDLVLSRPRAETPTHYLTMGLHNDLDQCAEQALRDMIALLGEVAGMTREDAYMLCSIAGDLRITQTVNSVKGVHMMMSKDVVEDIKARK